MKTSTNKNREARLYFLILICFISITAYAQEPSAIFELESTTQGILIPRMDSTQRNAITNPAEGLLVYDTTTMSFWYYVDCWKEGLGTKDKDWERSGNVVYNLGDSVYIGKSVDNPQNAMADFHIDEAQNVLFGKDLTGSGFKTIYYSDKGAFRCGYLTNAFGGYNYDKFWDYDSVGYYSWAGGQNSRAKGFGAFAFGPFGWADGSSSVAFFGHAKGNSSYTFGGSSKGRGSFTVEGVAEEEGGIAMHGYSGGRYGVSIGGGTTGLGASRARQDYSVAIGWNSDARGQAAIALGPNDAYGYNSFSTGWVTEARGNYSSTFGYRTNSYPYASMALGRYNVISGDSAVWVSTDPVFIIGDGPNNTSRSNSFMIQKNGQTAIGYDAPTGMLNISTELGSISGGGNVINFDNASLLIGNTSTGMVFDANQIELAGSPLYINFNSPEDVVLVDGGGKVGINTISPSEILEISDSGNTRLRVTSTNNVTAGIDLVRSSSNNTDWRIENNGNLKFYSSLNLDGSATEEYSFGTGIFRPTLDNNKQLGASGQRWTRVYAVNGTIQTSDLRFKKNIIPLEYGLQEIISLQPVSYQWKDGKDKNIHIGLIAQQVQKVIPEVVEDEDADILGMNYSELVPVLINAVKELVEQNEQFADLVDGLHAENKALEEKIRINTKLHDEMALLKTQISTLLDQNALKQSAN